MNQFYRPDQAGFAAVPLAPRGGYTERFFDPAELPLCPAGRVMPLKFTFIDRTRAIIEHERGKYVCPLRYPQVSGETCPIHHKRWAHGGCMADMPTSIGARIRYQLDRESDSYKTVYKQRAGENFQSQPGCCRSLIFVAGPIATKGEAYPNRSYPRFIIS
jgi:hypothetical protein